MKRSPCFVLLLSTVLIALGTPGAHAASPSSASLSKTRRTVTWTGQFTLSNPDPLGTACSGETELLPPCDHFLLKVDFSDGARIRILIHVPADADLDLYVYDPYGKKVAFSGDIPGQDERVTFTHRGRFRNKPYDVAVLPYTVLPGTTYHGSATAYTR